MQDYETEQDDLYYIGSILRSKPVEEPTVVSDGGIAMANDTDPNHPNPNPEEDTHGQSFITKALSGTSSVGSDLGKAIVKGVPKGAEETLYGAAELIGAPVDFVNFIASKVPGVGKYISSDMPVGGSDSIKLVLDAYNNFVNENIPGVQTANTWAENLEYDNQMLGNISEGLAQFSVAAVPAASMVKALTSANALVRGLYWGAIADYAAFNPNDETLTVMLTKMWDGATPEERSAIGNTAVSIMEKNESSPEIINRAKSMIEGGIVGGATEGLIKVLIEGAKYVPWKKAAAATAGGAAMNMQNPSDAEAGFLTSAFKGALKSGDNVVDNVVLPLTDGRISPRLPTAVNATEDGVTNSLQIDLAANKANPNQFDTNVNLISKYPNLRNDEVVGKTSDEIADTYVNHLKNNILWLHDRVPEATRLRSKQWYNGANKVTNTWAKEYNISNNSVAGVLAALSPQKDWYMNASLGNRVIDIMTNKQEFVFDKKMMQTAKQIYGSPKFANTIKFLSGKKLSELDNSADKSMWLRIYDEAHNDRSYRILSPEGDFGDFVKSADGQNAKVAWNSNVMIKNAINAFESGGDPAIITKFLGDRHKVRSFYNNIIAPNSDAGDVTIDTHAVAAATLRPVSGNSSIVFHNFGTSPLLAKRPKDWNGATANSSVNGVKGTYAFYAEAYRLAAAERGVLPREMQSITWEAVRGLFPATFKQNAKNVGKIDALWYNYRDGKLSLEEVLNGIEQITGGINPPSWE